MIDKIEKKNSKIMILGATGFIGKNIALYFSKKFKIKATYNKKVPFKNNNIQWIKCDLKSTKQINNLFNNVDIVINAAAVTSGVKDIIDRPHIHVNDNALMNINILKEIFKNNNIKHYIFFSCTVMYQSSNRKQDEQKFNYQIIDKYFGVGWTKVYIEKLCKFYSNFLNTKFTMIRHSNIYGPYDKFDLEKSHVLGATISKVMKAEKEITIWGRGNEIRDFLYISDLIRFVELIMKKQKKKYEIYNCGSETGIKILDLAKLIIKITGRSIKIKRNVTAPTIKFNLVVDCKKAKKEIGWKSKVSLSEGIKKTLIWWKKNKF
jgi:nucleoside-diphosphate-sugar epimerase